MKKYFISLMLVLLCSCTSEKIETADTLPASTIALIKALSLADSNEKIIRFYSNFQKDKAGNFFTEKRIAHYWLDDNHPEGTEKSYAFYKNILSIDTIYEVPDTFSPYMVITKDDSSTFNVYVDGTKQEIKKFYEEAIRLWKQNK